MWCKPLTAESDEKLLIFKEWQFAIAIHPTHSMIQSLFAFVTLPRYNAFRFLFLLQFRDLFGADHWGGDLFARGFLCVDSTGCIELLIHPRDCFLATARFHKLKSVSIKLMFNQRGCPLTPASVLCTTEPVYQLERVPTKLLVAYTGHPIIRETLLDSDIARFWG
jgi:hypothetical protein